MKVFRFFGWLALAAAVLFFVVVRYSAVESKYECAGEVSTNGDVQKSNLYFELQEYRWWVGLWSDSDGDMKIEIPHKTAEFYDHLKFTGSTVVISETNHDAQSNRKLAFRGDYSKLSSALWLETRFGIFKGSCRQIG